MKKKVILSLTPIGHDTAAALMINGEIVAACVQERYTRDKHSYKFPLEAVKDCLSIAGISVHEVGKSCIIFTSNGSAGKLIGFISMISGHTVAFRITVVRY